MDLSTLYKVQEQVESGGNPLAVSPKGARGPMQTMPTTLTDPGYGVKPAADNSIEEQRRVGQDYMAAMLREYNNDLPTALAAYNWGPKSVNDWRKAGADPAKMPKETRDYIAKITGNPDVLAARAGALKATRSAMDAAVQSLVVRPDSEARQNARRDTEAFGRRVTEEARPTGWEMFGGAMAGNTDQQLGGGLTELARSIFRPEFEPVAGYKADLAALPPTADSTLVEDYSTASSPQAAEKVLKAWEAEQERTQAVMDRGMLPGLGLSFLAETGSVVNWTTAYAAPALLASRGLGSIALAAEGRRGASVASAIAENALSGTAVEAVNQSLKGKLDGTALLVSAVADSLIGAATGIHGVSTITKAERFVTTASEDAIVKTATLAARAEAELGNAATSGDLRRVMDRLEAEDMKAAIKEHEVPIPPEQQLIREPVVAKQTVPEQEPTSYASGNYAQRMELRSTTDAAFNDKVALGIFKATDDFDERKAQVAAINANPGVHLTEAMTGNGTMKRYAKAIDELRKQLIPDVAIHLADVSGLSKTFDGVAGVIKPGVGLIAVKPGGGMRAAVHEFGHVVFQHKLAQATPEERQAMYAAWNDWKKTFSKEGAAQESMLGRSPVSAVGDASRKAAYLPALEGRVSESLKDVFTPEIFGGDKAKAAKFQSYFSNFDEFSAEQFVKHVESLALGETTGKLTVPETIIAALKSLVASALDIFRKAKDSNLIAPNANFAKFFDSLVAGNQKAGLPALDLADELAPMAVPAKPADVVNELMTDPDAIRFGLTTLPVATATERKHAQAILALHKQADDWAKRNPMDAAWESRMKNLADNTVFNVASVGLTMLKSKNPLVRMIASELVEDASGVAGKRNATAAIGKWMMERKMLGNTVNDVFGAFEFWKASKDIGRVKGFKDDMIGGANWAAYNKEIASEIEARRLAKAPVSTDPNIKAAVDSLEAAYQRTANAQRWAKTLGHEGLPESSVGYMPHRMSPKAVINLTNEQTRILHSALTDQFITIEGWDASFSDQLASSYIKRVRDRAAGDYGSSVGGASPSTQSMVEEALRGMDLPEDTIKAHMAKFSKGAANFTKGRIELDLNRVYPTEQGDFRLLDIFETNQVELLRSQAGRASGEVALTRFGVQGKPGLKLLRDAMQFGEDGKRTAVRENEAFDQMAAEFLNEPFGTQSGKFMERAMAANAAVRLGGIAFNQIAESINGIAHVGVAGTWDSMTSILRLRSEVKDLVAGKQIDNPILGSIELVGGAEFGTDAYKVTMPFDSPDHLYPTYGQDTLTLTDRVLRGAGHLQSKLSGWRMIHSAQQRGMAEQVVHKMMRYIREGKDDVALQQFGVNESMRAHLRANMDTIAEFDKNGNLLRLDVTKIPDADIREQVIQAVWRGSSQIIQGTYIGERGKWAHDGWLKLLTQFRSFSITSMEKQWGRQRNSRGAAAAFGLLMGTMSIAVPVYMARVYANAAGRPDADEYIEERMTPGNLARATLNYTAMSGVSGDLMDLLTATLPDSMGMKPTGGRAGVESTFVGNYVAPSLSLVDDIWKYAQSPTDIDELAKLLPGSRIPYLLPLVNATKE